MDIRDSRILLVGCGALVFFMIYFIGVGVDFFPPPSELWARVFGDTYLWANS